MDVSATIGDIPVEDAEMPKQARAKFLAEKWEILVLDEEMIIRKPEEMQQKPMRSISRG